MGFAITQHVRARHASGNVLIFGFDRQGDAIYAVFIKENGDLDTDWIGNLQVEMHFDAEANDWKDDWEPEPPPAYGIDPAWFSGVGHGSQDEADGDPELQGQDRTDQGAGDGDPPGGDSGNVDASP